MTKKTIFVALACLCTLASGSLLLEAIRSPYPEGKTMSLAVITTGGPSGPAAREAERFVAEELFIPRLAALGFEVDEVYLGHEPVVGNRSLESVTTGERIMLVLLDYNLGTGADAIRGSFVVFGGKAREDLHSWIYRSQTHDLPVRDYSRQMLKEMDEAIGQFHSRFLN